LKNIAKIKSKELNTNDITNQLKIIAGTAKNMGIIII
jgi:ribosomal protein L11